MNAGSSVVNLNKKLSAMRRILKKKWGLLITGLLMMPIITLAQQKSKWGEDSATAVKNYALYRSFVQTNEYDKALPYWRYVFKNAPCARQRIYTDGEKIMEFMINNAQDEQTKNAYIDTLLMLFDKRIECFDNEGVVLARKAYYMIKYKRANEENMLELGQTAITRGKEKTAAYLLPIYFRYAVRAYKKKLISPDSLLNIYGSIQQVIAANTGNQKYNSSAVKVAEELKKSGLIQTCEDVDKLLIPRYEANPSDTLVWKLLFSVMRSLECYDLPYFTEIGEKLVDSLGDYKAAISLAKAYKKQNKCSKAIEMLLKGAEKSPDNDLKAELYLTAAQLEYKCRKNFARARDLARKAASLKPNWGEPYLLIGDLYAASSTLDCIKKQPLGSKAVFWAAIDMYQKAKSIDPSVAEEANKKIARYKEFTPTKEDIHFHLLKEGETYEIGCWMGVSTKVRIYH